MFKKLSKDIYEKIKQIHSDDKEQLEAIFSNEKRIILEGPAGYGKTKTMISRIAYLIATNKVPNPKKILALTFSVNAAYKIKKDVAKHLPLILSDSSTPPALIRNKVFATNYHGLCRRILRLYGYLLHESLKRMEFLKSIDDSNIKGLTEIGLTYDDAKFLSDYSEAVKDKNKKLLSDKRPMYIKKVKRELLPRGFISFNGIILLVIELFEKYHYILNFYRTFFPIIIVDEFQDTNMLSWDLLEYLISEETELFLMGDPLQRIYGFIGAIPDLMSEAKKKYNLYKIELKTNYRFKDNFHLLYLDQNIRENAKNPVSPNIKIETKLQTIEALNQSEEAEAIVDLTKNLLKKDSTAEIAVLVKQRGRNTDLILEAFNNAGLPFFYALYSDEDREYIEFHQMALKEFSAVLSRGGRLAYNTIVKRFLSRVENNIKERTSEIFDSLFMLLNTFLSRIHIEFKFLSIDEKIELIKDVLKNKSLKQYLGHIDSKIVISTVHGSKGLEWDYVILPDLERYSFPSYRGLCRECPFQVDCNIDWQAAKDVSGFEEKFYEELSVFYVAVTRARKEVFFTYSNKRIDSNGKEREANISCFLKLPGIKIVRIL